MRTIIAGSRDIIDKQLVFDANEVSLEKYPADWETYGRRAGIMRNKSMSKTADALIVVWDGFSRGSMNMINTAKIAGLRIYEVNLDEVYNPKGSA